MLQDNFDGYWLVIKWRFIIVMFTIDENRVSDGPACKVTQCTSMTSRTRDGTIRNWWVNKIATSSSPLLLISVVCLPCGFNSGSKHIVQLPEWCIWHLVCALEIIRAKTFIHCLHFTSNTFPCGSSFSTPFFLISTLPKMGSGDRSSHYNRGWFNGKGFIGSGHGQVDSLAPHTHLLTGGKYLNVQWYVTMIAPRASSSKMPLPLNVGEYPAVARWWVRDPTYAKYSSIYVKGPLKPNYVVKNCCLWTLPKGEFKGSDF